MGSSHPPFRITNKTSYLINRRTLNPPNVRAYTVSPSRFFGVKKNSCQGLPRYSWHWFAEEIGSGTGPELHLHPMGMTAKQANQSRKTICAHFQTLVPKNI